jgi:hypothetical protein
MKLPPLIQWRSERCVPPFRGEGWGKRAVQSALCFRFGVLLHPEPLLLPLVSVFYSVRLTLQRCTQTSFAEAMFAPSFSIQTAQHVNRLKPNRDD